MDDSLATVIPFPHPGTAPRPTSVDPAALEDYWALLQRLRAERRRLVGSATG